MGESEQSVGEEIIEGLKELKEAVDAGEPLSKRFRVSKPGAAIQVDRIELTPEQHEGLTTGVKSMGEAEPLHNPQELPDDYPTDGPVYCICPDCGHVIQEHGYGRLYRYCRCCAVIRLDKLAEVVRRA